MKKDHIDPVVPLSGFSSWDDIIRRLFVGEDGWQAICVTCHDKKTKEENDKRKALRKEKAVLKYFKKRVKEEA
jgi:5-methylcytosine-specific restriction endonuclease McrA